MKKIVSVFEKLVMLSTKTKEELENKNVQNKCEATKIIPAFRNIENMTYCVACGDEMCANVGFCITCGTPISTYIDKAIA